MEVATFDKSIVNKKELLASRFPGEFRFTHIPRNGDMFGFLMAFNHLLLVGLSENTNNALAEFTGRQVVILEVVLIELEPYLGVGQGHTGKLIINMAQLNSI